MTRRRDALIWMASLAAMAPTLAAIPDIDAGAGVADGDRRIAVARERLRQLTEDVEALILELRRGSEVMAQVAAASLAAVHLSDEGGGNA